MTSETSGVILVDAGFPDIVSEEQSQMDLRWRMGIGHADALIERLRVIFYNGK